MPTTISYEGNNETYYANVSNEQHETEEPLNSYAAATSSNGTSNNNNHFLGIRSGSSALKNKQGAALRAASNERKSSCGGDSAAGAGQSASNPFFLNQKVDNFRLGANASK
mmetsp:Transcript_27160/g.36292  ORF Transcript_27160/g.36292 Transcript_27160/m.36292 type:complete len:111 (+) Transcript_27160:443-775(+)